MAEAAVTFLMEQVKDVVTWHRDLISSAKHEFELLMNDLFHFKAFLKDAATKTKKENLFTELEKRIKEVVYEIEDAIDDCLTIAIKSKYKPSKFTVAKKVKDIRENKVSQIYKDVTAFISSMHSIHIAGGSAAVQLPTITQLKRDKAIRQKQIVGFKDEEHTIIEYLTGEPDVISIIGIPGQGKTTLAWKIYRNEMVGDYFPVRIWVYVSQQFSTRDVFLQIVRKFAAIQDTSGLSDDELVQTVRECLEKENFLLVLDDVCSVDAWNKIKEVLPLNGKGKVLITSREMDLGKITGKSHMLRFLTEKESWALLQYEVFGNEEDSPKELRAIGKVIAAKCDGVALTIVVIGGILKKSQPKGKAEKVYWEMVSKSVSEALQNYEAECITEVVALSYDRLPYDLRNCFLYMGVFPEDYEIPVKMLCYLWIAEGFIQLEDEKSSLEECADKNLIDLINRNLLRVDKTNAMGEVKTCRVHVMIRAFCIIKSKEENLFHEIKKPNAGVPNPSVPEAQQLRRRVCCHSDLSSFLSTAPNCSQARSFLCFYKQRVQLNPDYINVIPDSFPKLRILESMSIKFHQFPARLVSKLIHLKYLTLYIETLTILPEAISQPWNLQTIIIETRMRSITMKANISKMIQLRHLKTKAAIVLDTKWKGKAGQNLRTLDRLSPESCTEVFFQRAKNLKTLGISGKLANFIEIKFLENLQHLEKLKLVNSLTYEPTSEDSLQSLTQWKCFPPSLKKLTLANTFLSWKHMSVLAKIKTLEVLKLKDNAFIGVSWESAEEDTFPNLQLLLIANADFFLWEPSTSTFPELRYLVVKNCENLQEIPECLGTHLQKLEIERVRDSAVDSAKKIGEAKMGELKGKCSVEFELKLGSVTVELARPTTYFKYDFTLQQPTDLTYQGDAHFTTDPAVLRLTATDTSGIPQCHSIGRIVHTTPVTMYERGRTASFVSTIRFLITPHSECGPADGLAFFIAPVGYPVGKYGEGYGVFDMTRPNPNSRVLAVAFDTFCNEGDSARSPHVEIDIGSITSKRLTEVGNALVGQVVHARITYDATTKLISVDGAAGSITFKVEYQADLSTVFPHEVQVGISAATGEWVALHDVLSWSFNSHFSTSFVRPY